MREEITIKNRKQNTRTNQKKAAYRTKETRDINRMAIESDWAASQPASDRAASI
jgi:hypothetical protein